jgi:Na+-translocating ferredoxin:NAD+ oxidoreductase subunit B
MREGTLQQPNAVYDALLAGGEMTTLADALDAVLPQTQCGKCGYAGCRPYAEALANGVADINQCPPGGGEGVAEIAALLGVPAKPLDERFGPTRCDTVALIEEDGCIGCTLCIQACPVDAIVGAAKLMHTVIAAACTGCELCIPPCPTDCIRLIDVPARDRGTRRTQARTRFEAHERRLARERHDKAAKLEAQRAASAHKRKRETIARALERARQRLESRKA